MIRLVGIAGSLRRHSNSLAVLHSIAERVATHAQLVIHPLDDVPLYNADLDGESPPAGVVALKLAIETCDGLVICSPEYNYGIPGVLKNAIDWASRPGFKSPLKRKPALIVTTSPGMFGGVRAQAQIRDALAATLARPIARQHVAIPLVVHKLAEGRIVDETTLKLLDEALDDFMAEVDYSRLAARPR